MLTGKPGGFGGGGPEWESEPETLSASGSDGSVKHTKDYQSF